MFLFKSLGPPRTVKQSWDRWPPQVGLLGHKSSYFSRDWLRNPVILHNRSWGFKISHTHISGGREDGLPAIPSTASFPSSLLCCLNPLFLVLPWRPPPPLPPSPCNALTYLEVGCRSENPSPFLVSVVATFITQKETGSPNSPWSLWPLLYFIYLFIDFATAHTGAQGGSVYSTKTASAEALLERAVSSSVSLRWELGVPGFLLLCLFLRLAQLKCYMFSWLFIHVSFFKTWVFVEAKEMSFPACAMFKNNNAKCK